MEAFLFVVELLEEDISESSCLSANKSLDVILISASS